MGLQDYYNTGDDTDANIFTATWLSQTFTANSTYTVTSIKLFLLRIGTIGDINVSIRATSSGTPTGADLAIGTTDCSAISTVTPEWVEFILDTPYEVTGSTQYAIVVDASSASGGSNKLTVRTHGVGAYANGQYWYSTNSGGSWNTLSSRDFLFEVYEADANYAELSGTVAGQSGLSANLEIITFAELSGTITAQSSVPVVSLGSTTVALTVKTYERRSLLLAGNNKIYYEDV